MLSWSAFAQFGSMTIRSQNYNQRFWVFVDDVLQNQYSVNSIKIQGMNIQQKHKVRVEVEDQEQNILGKTVFINAQPRNNNYEIQYRNGGYIFKASNFIMTPSLSMYLILPNYNYYNDYYSFLNPGFGNYGNYWGSGGKKYSFMNAPEDCYPNYGNNNQGGNYGNNQGGNYGNNQGGNHGNNQGPNYGNNQGGGQIICMPTNEFNNAYNSIKNDSFESSKLNKAKQIISRNRMCTAQILQIVRLFSFESNKLELAKYAYQYCNDKNSYYQVTDAFSFQSSKDELLKYIRN